MKEKFTYLIEFSKHPNSQLKVIRDFSNVKRIERVSGVAIDEDGKGLVSVEPPQL